MGQEYRQKFHRQIKNLLPAGGIIILEAFSKEQLSFGTGGPGNPDLLFTVEMLRNDFSGLQMLELYQSNEFLNEGLYHQGEASVVRMVAQKTSD